MSTLLDEPAQATTTRKQALPAKRLLAEQETTRDRERGFAWDYYRDRCRDVGTGGTEPAADAAVTLAGLLQRSGRDQYLLAAYKELRQRFEQNADSVDLMKQLAVAQLLRFAIENNGDRNFIQRSAWNLAPVGSLPGFDLGDAVERVHGRVSELAQQARQS